MLFAFKDSRGPVGVIPAESAFKGNTFDGTVLLSCDRRFFVARIIFWR